MKRTKQSRTRTEVRGSNDVDAYLASLPVDSRSALQQLRQSIAAVATDAEEGFSYGLPAFRLGGRPLVCYRAAKNHLSFYPMSPAVIEKHARDLKGYKTSKGTIRFSPEKPLPLPLLRKLVKARIAELQKPGK